MNPGPIPPFYVAYRPASIVPFRWIGAAWQLFTARLGLWVGATLALLAVSTGLLLGSVLLIGSVGSSHASSSGDTTFGWDLLLGGDILIGLPYLLCGLLFSPAAYRMAVRQARGEPVGWEDLFRVGPIFGRLLGFWAVGGALVLIGLALCVVPGLLLAGLLLPTPALIADGAGVLEAIWRSLSVMSRGWLPAISLTLLCASLLGAGLAPCGLGLLVAQPLVWLLSAVAAREAFGPSAAALERHGEPNQENVWPPPPNITLSPPPPPFV